MLELDGAPKEGEEFIQVPSKEHILEENWTLGGPGDECSGSSEK